MGFAPDDLKHFRDILRMLDAVTPGLGVLAYEHVVTGRIPDVLRQVEKGSQSLRPDALRHLVALSTSSNSILVAPQGWDASVVRRLGHVLAAYEQLRLAPRFESCSEPLEFFGALTRITEAYAASADSWLLTGPRCLELLKLVDADQRALVQILFSPYNVDGHRFKRLLAMAGLPAALAAAPERAVLGAKALSAYGQRHWIRWLHKRGLNSEPVFRDFLCEAAGGCGATAGLALVALLSTPDARHALQLRAQAASPTLRRQIGQALSLLPPPQSTPPEEAGSGYVALGGEWIAIPPAPPLPADTPPPAGFEAALRAVVLEAREALHVSALWASERHFRRSHLRQALNGMESFADAGIGPFLAVMGGKALTSVPAELLGQPPVEDALPWTVMARYRRNLRELLSRPEVTLHHLARLYAARPRTTAEVLDPSRIIALYLVTGATGPVARELLHAAALAAGDFRPVLEACARCGSGSPEEVLCELLQLPKPLFATGVRPPLWQVVAQHLHLIDQALGLAPSQKPLIKQRALELLRRLPATPAQYRDTLAVLAVHGQDGERPLARALLSSDRGIRAHILGLLASDNPDRRSTSARWLQEQRARGAVGELRCALAREQLRDVRIALLESLAGLGELACQELREPGLLEEAPECSEDYTGDEEHLMRVAMHVAPELKWADGHAVDPALIRAWVLQAARLKRPCTPPVLRLVLDQLDASSAQALGLAVLSSPLTPQHPGLLTLTRRAPPLSVARTVKHPLLSAGLSPARKCRLLRGLAQQPAAPAILQLLEEVAAGSPEKRVQAHAEALLAQLATQLGLTRAELSDLAAPTGGFDEHGEQLLSTPGGPITVTIGADLQVRLKGAGRGIVDLPEPNDLSSHLEELRRELEPIIDRQGERLQHAMTQGRIWRTEQIRAHLFAHPVVGRLCELLIFAGVDPPDDKVTFRPLSDGSCLNAAGDPIDITGLAGVQLAHRALMDEPQAHAWQQHLEDYQIVPLFAQLR